MLGVCYLVVALRIPLCFYMFRLAGALPGSYGVLGQGDSLWRYEQRHMMASYIVYQFVIHSPCTVERDIVVDDPYVCID